VEIPVEEAVDGLEEASGEVLSDEYKEVDVLLLANVVGVLFGLLVEFGAETVQAPVMDGTASTPLPMATISVPQFAAGAIKILKLS
jgi:hypothetical protein